MITITNEKGEHLSTDKHGLFCWTPDPQLAIRFADGDSATRLARATGNLQVIQAHRGISAVSEDAAGAFTASPPQAMPALPTKDELGTGSVT
jgi:hypothetical protein